METQGKEAKLLIVFFHIFKVSLKLYSHKTKCISFNGGTWYIQAFIHSLWQYLQMKILFCCCCFSLSFGGGYCCSQVTGPYIVSLLSVALSDRHKTTVCSRGFCHRFLLIAHQALPTHPHLTRLCISTLNPTRLYPIRSLEAGVTVSIPVSQTIWIHRLIEMG